MPTEQGTGGGGRALVVVPGTVNYFYNQAGRRVAEALRSLGVTVDLTPVADFDPGAAYDWGFVSNLAEVRHAAGDPSAADAWVAGIRRACRWLGCLAIDCIDTHWYHILRDLCHQAGVDAVLDLGLHDQSARPGGAAGPGYAFVFSGLTPSERRQFDHVLRDDDDAGGRPFPWAFVGHNTYHRAGLVDRILQTVDPRGFVYLPHLTPYTEKGSPHLNQQQFELVLRKSRYQVWCSHHPHFYMEPERFRTALLAGCVPIKVLDDTAEAPKGVPFRYLMMHAADLAGRLAPDLAGRVRRQYADDWRRLPTLAGELARAVPGVAAATGVGAAGERLSA